MDMHYPYQLPPLPYAYEVSLPTSAATRSTFTMTSTFRPMWTT